MTALYFLIPGLIFIASGIFSFKKLPGVRLKYVRILIVVGVLSVAAGLTLFFALPKKGILPDGTLSDYGDDDSYGRSEKGGDIPTDPGVILIRGGSIITEGMEFDNIASFDGYITTSSWQGGYELIDDYASYSAYEAVRKVLKDRGKSILSERTSE